MPRSNKMYFVQKNCESAIEANGNAAAGSALSCETESSSQQLVTVNPLTMEREVLATNIPEALLPVYSRREISDLYGHYRGQEEGCTGL